MNGKRVEPYALFARRYDGGWSEYSGYVLDLIETIESDRGRRFESICDAACGTGILLARSQPDRAPAGFDRSPEMLARARRRLPNADLRLGDLADPPEFDRRFDLVTCMYDSLNYLLSADHLAAFFRWVRATLRSDGIAIVDANTAEIYAADRVVVRNHLIDGEAFREEQRFERGPPPRVHTTFRFPGGEEHHEQRPYESETILELADHAGLGGGELLDVVDRATGIASGKIVYVFGRER